LARFHDRLELQDDQFELVLSVGHLAWAPTGFDTIATHLVTARAGVKLDMNSGEISVELAGNVPMRLRDKELLENYPGYDARAAASIYSRIRPLSTPFADEIKIAFEDWLLRAVRSNHGYGHDELQPAEPSDTPRLNFAPALVLRKRGRHSLIDYYDAMLGALSGPDAVAPLGLAQLLTSLEPQERLSWLEEEGLGGGLHEEPLFPLPTNEEQRRVFRRLAADNGVVVQGPPGTGKSHSIANLVSALLAQGQRVLVTSQKAQALRVLNDKLPPEIAELCVSMTDLARGGSLELNRSVNALSTRFDDFDPERQVKTIRRNEAALEKLRGAHARLWEEIRALREAETYVHLDVAEGFEGTAARMAQQVNQGRAEHDWVGVPLPSPTPDTFPLLPSEFVELRQLLAKAGEEAAARLRQVFPPHEALPAPVQVSSWMDELGQAEERAAQLNREHSGLVDALEPIFDQGSPILQAALGDWATLGSEASDEKDWRIRALGDMLSGRNMVAWRQLLRDVQHTEEALACVDELGIREVDISFAIGPGESPAEHLLSGEKLHAWLEAGNSLKRRFQKPVQQQASALLAGAKVDGLEPSTPQLLRLVLSSLKAETITASLVRRWAEMGVEVDTSKPLRVRLSALAELEQGLRAIDAIHDQWDQITFLLKEEGSGLRITSLASWVQVLSTFEALKATQVVDGLRRRLAAFDDKLAEWGKTSGAPPEAQRLAEALAERDPGAYRAQFEALVAARLQREEMERAEVLIGPLRAAHPTLALLLERTAASPAWEARASSLEQSWQWARAASFLRSKVKVGRDEELDAELAEVVRRIESSTGKLAAAKAWYLALTRMTEKQTTALRQYRTILQGWTKAGKYRHRDERAARAALGEAKDAVPAWIMPIPDILDTVPPQQNSFDVVIVDEASQAGIETLFLLWLAPRVIVVGDEKQCAPSMVARGEIEPIFRNLEDSLHDVPEHVRHSFTPRSSLFSLLSSRFGSVIRLREHFRCMPEIINWSSQSFYGDEPLIPLRQFGSSRLQPLKTTLVEGGYIEGTGQSVRNTGEAREIVSAVADCLSDPQYKDKTFGVVVLQGRRQVTLIEQMLEERFPKRDLERRRLRVGTPPDFQGDERDVVFLSMVASGTPRALTTLVHQRRFNVAASRAKDQLWLFHSVTPDALSPLDLRRSLLTYMRHPTASLALKKLDEVREDVRQAPFDSLFEQRVFLRITKRGFAVIPQYEINGFKIDLMIVGPDGRLAVECDGDAWHSSAEDRAADDAREITLKRAGLKFFRIGESEFYTDEAAVFALLWQELDRLGISPVTLEESDSSDHGKWAPTAVDDDEGDEEGADQILTDALA